MDDIVLPAITLPVGAYTDCGGGQLVAAYYSLIYPEKR